MNLKPRIEAQRKMRSEKCWDNASIADLMTLFVGSVVFCISQESTADATLAYEKVARLEQELMR